MQDVLKSGAFEQAGRRLLPSVDPAIIDIIADLAKSVQNGLTEMVARVAKQILSDDEDPNQK